MTIPSAHGPGQGFSPADVRDHDDREWRLVPLPELLKTTIRGVLLNALAYTGGDQQAAAKLLGITPRVMNYMMTTYHIPAERGPTLIDRQATRQRKETRRRARAKAAPPK